MHDIILDPTLKEYRRAISTGKEAQRKDKLRANKRRANAQHGPTAHTPISANRKKKILKSNADNDKMNDEDDSSTTDISGDKETNQQVNNDMYKRNNV